ncbi:sugar transferase [Pullulanibacillus sp. KACC 23026]|uniref:sugar transferase n=1 Tax=Pullulanibacillus sp. KACC 23026 TaxID=3028315 RepID=UPI0023B14DB2|nr:sugar transferase [Pullulanibacillus sp. KACC 23026]WEG13384.1 sugar transferase [Pullulanibacillus sp. KACC 23026]
MEPQRIEAARRFVNVNAKDNRVYLIMKRTIDILGALVGLILLSPLFLIVGLLIKTEDSKGPVFFTQKRVGLNQKEFTMIKFRSMVVNAEEMLASLMEQNEASGLMFKMKNDPRVLKIGKFIRKTSIDELPQLINVLKGDMSLVGPRPPLPWEVNEYTSYELQRLTVVPGCTGLWQVSGRSNIGFEEMVELDLTYIQKRDFWYDLKIIFKTVILLFGSNDAF